MENSYFPITTDRLLLREFMRTDFDALSRVFGDADAMCHYPYRFDEERVRFWIDRNIERYRVFGFGLWAVVLKETGELIGDCGLTMQDINGFIRPEIGYHIRRDLWRRGFAKEAASACRDWAFMNTPFNALFSYMKKANVASSATARSIGMSLVEEFTDAQGELSCAYEVDRCDWENGFRPMDFSPLIC